MKSKKLNQHLPSKYRELLEKTWHLNRVHNGPEQLLGMQRVLDFIKKSSNAMGNYTLGNQGKPLILGPCLAHGQLRVLY